MTEFVFINQALGLAPIWKVYACGFGLLLGVVTAIVLAEFAGEIGQCLKNLITKGEKRWN